MITCPLEIITRIANIQNIIYHVKTRHEIEHLCVAAGSHIMKSYDVKRKLMIVFLEVVQIYVCFSGRLHKAHLIHGYNKNHLPEFQRCFPCLVCDF